MGEVMIRCGGVAEHFNLPWKLALESGKFEQSGYHVEWSDFPGGTGEMCKALRQGQLDLAIMLTEGAVTDIIQGSPARIHSLYTSSPLTWGVHVPGDTILSRPEEFSGNQFAISRYKSGSHLMAHVYASKLGWQLKPEDFKIVYGLDGARIALKTGKSRLFLWEKFTTRPYVNNGEFKLIDECPTPWPGLVIVVHQDAMAKHAEIIGKVIDIVRGQTHQLLNYAEAPNLIAGRYGFLLRDAIEWFNQIQWNFSNELDLATIQNVNQHLYKLGIVENFLSENEVVEQLLLSSVNQPG